MRRTNTENPDTSTAKQRFFDRTLALHTDCLGVTCRVQANALMETGIGLDKWDEQVTPEGRDCFP